MQFDFYNGTRILFGTGIRSEIPLLAAQLGKRVLFVTDSKERSKAIVQDLIERGLVVFCVLIKHEPIVGDIILATRNSHENRCDLVIGCGGGSAIDTGKATAAFSTNPGNPIDYLEQIGSGRLLEHQSAPYIAIPTTAGTGAEVTRNAVISVPEARIKVSLRSSYLFPKIAIIDPELTYSLPPFLTAETGMDALTQLIEPFVCISPTPLTDAICRDGIRRVARSLGNALSNGMDIEARQEMALASLMGGIALSNARLGAVHGLASPIGGMSHAPHGAICARLLPLVMDANLRAMRHRQMESASLRRYQDVARLLTGNENAEAEEGAVFVNKLCQAMNIRPLQEYGLSRSDFQEIVERSKTASSMKGNPIPLTDNELMEILVKAY